jgi:DNA-binding XRE family transcriptional regulator
LFLWEGPLLAKANNGGNQVSGRQSVSLQRLQPDVSDASIFNLTRSHARSLKNMISVEQIRAARSWLGISQQELADAAGVEVKTIHRIETGFRGATDRTLERIRRAFEATGIEFVFEGSKPVGLRSLSAR